MSSESLTAFAYHGGALDVARRLAPEAPKPWIDLSTGINPHAYPLPDLEPDIWARLPTGEAITALESAAARRYGAAPEAVVAGPGSQALIHALARLGPKGVIGGLGAIYGGHAEAFAAAGARLVQAASLESLADCDVAVVVNPNNPDGRVAGRIDLLDLHERLVRRSGLLVVDEAFADFDGDESLAPFLPETGAVVLRSFGKTFGLAGLRLGFALASPDVGKRLRAALGPWPVSGPAIAIGAKALVDLEWTAAMGVRLGQDAARLDTLLLGSGWQVLGGTRLFRLAAREDVGKAFERLLGTGILTRPFPALADRLRFGIPGEEPHWERLAAALRG
ncbi:MAG TPA: threonine-phosphate decarboxylase CobD [Roseiarcus sp.]|nr:threonine-phosphate decarboxylase CobD [Roseiarcus sp.]